MDLSDYVRALPEARKAFLSRLLIAPEPPDFRVHLDGSIKPLFAAQNRVPHPGGRPSGYTAEIARSVCAYMVCLDVGIAPALRHFGISRATAWRWRKSFAFFEYWVAESNAFNKRLRASKLDGVMKLKQVARRRTVTKGCFVSSRRSGFNESMVKSIKPGIRSTARELGVSPSTVIRWSRKYYHDFGAPLDRAFIAAKVDKLKRILKHPGFDKEQSR